MECRICSSEEVKSKHTGKDVWNSSNATFEYSECANCGLIQIDDYPANLDFYYSNDEYYSFVNKKEFLKGRSLKEILVRFRDKFALSNYGVIGRILFLFNPTNVYNILSHVQISKTSSIIDIGCGDGEFVKRLVSLGYKNACGTDPFLKEEVLLEGGQKISNLSIHDVKGQFDIVCLRNSLEHMPNQLDVLLSAKNLVKDTGRIVIRIPIVPSLVWHKYGTNWVQFDAPRHLYLHTRESVKILAQKAGLRCENIKCDSGAFQFIGSEQLKEGIVLNDERSWLRSREKSIFSDKDVKFFRRKAKKLNRSGEGDVVVITLKK